MTVCAYVVKFLPQGRFGVETYAGDGRGEPIRQEIAYFHDINDRTIEE